MVRREVWQAASREGETPRFLCIGCLEGRIGRRLVPTDFADLDINDVSGLETERLRDRLGETPGESR